MKPASAPANGGEVVETTIRKRVVPADPAGKKENPDFWDYFEAIKADDWSSYRHKLFIYRYQGDVPAGLSEQMEKNESGVMTMPSGEQVKLDNREDAEDAIAQKFGGGLFRLILKRGSERVTETKVHTFGPRKAVPAPTYREMEGPTVSTMSDATADVAHHAIDQIAKQDRTAMDVAVNALKGAADVVQRFSKPQEAVTATTIPTEMDQMFKTLMLRMMERMLVPQDPIELLTKLMALQSQLNPSGQTNPMIGKVLDVAVEKLLNPPATGPVSSAGAELVRQLPAVASYVTQAMHEWRSGMEAQRDAVALQRGQAPPARVVQPALPPAPAAAPTPTPPPGAPSLEFIESRIVQILREPLSAEDAAENVYGFLDTLDPPNESGNPRLIQQLVMLGEGGLLNTFHMRPTLKPATQNVPRLQEFIKAFLKYAADTEGAPAKPN